MVESHKKYDLQAIAYDPWQADLKAKQLRVELGILTQPWQMTPKNLDLMTTKLLQVFRNQQISLYREPDLIGDLQHLRIVERQTGYRLSPVKNQHGHGDRAIALAIALPLCLAWMPQIRRARREADEPETLVTT